MDALDRLYWRLAEALRRDPAQPPERRLSIAEIYQVLVPYRAVRTDLGLWELAQYEHALLRLLAGERGYLALEEPAVADEFRRELLSPNPILGLYRDYPDSGAYAAAPAERTAAPPPHPAAPDAAAGDGVAVAPAAPLRLVEREADGDGEGEGEGDAGWGAPDAPLPLLALAPEPVEPAEVVSCHACSSVLPRGRQARFCPFCGAPQRMPCRACGELLEPGWRFCIDCGEPRLPGGVAP